MSNHKSIHIKNMVCPRCITVVKSLLDNKNIPYTEVRLGEVKLVEKPDKINITNLQIALKKHGFEILNDAKSTLISQIKTLIIQQIHHQNQDLKTNYSNYLSKSLNQEYSTLSKLFSSVEGITLEKYILKQKIQRVKELLFYDQLTLSEIAHQMGYSSTAHLSTQFKKETGMTATAFRRLRNPGLQSLDAL